MPNFTQAQWNLIQQERFFLEAMEHHSGGQVAVFGCSTAEAHVSPTRDGYFEVQEYDVGGMAQAKPYRTMVFASFRAAIDRAREAVQYGIQNADAGLDYWRMD
jgi:hypothetical protein